MKLMLKLMLLLVVIVYSWLTACGQRTSVSVASRVVLGQKTFLIPKSNQLETAMPAWLKRLPGLDDGSRSFLVQFPAADIASNIAGYRIADGNLQENINGVLSVLTPKEVQRYEHAEQLAELWRRDGSYKDAIVEPYTAFGWYKVFRKVEYPYSWALLKYLPPKLPNPVNSTNFWVAQCLERTSAITSSKRHVACKTFVQFGDVAVDIELSENNIGFIDQLRVFIETEVTKWTLASGSQPGF